MTVCVVLSFVLFMVACSDQRSVNAPVPQPTAAKVLALVEADTSNGAGPGRAVLVAFYEATDGANWLRSDKWISEAPLREWHRRRNGRQRACY